MVRFTSAVLAVFLYLIPAALGVHLHGRDINEPLLESYDYIVVGCGISGLVVSNRLSEIASRTVLCIEAGDADHYEAVVQDPVYVGADIGGIYDWDLETVPQTQLDGNTRPMPQGKVLGGGSILNAMCWNRGGSDDFDAWEAFGNPGWGWASILPYFMKSETYTPVYSDEIADEYSIHYNPAVHGTSGPVQVSYPKYFYPQSINLFAGMNLLGLPTQFDPNDGTSAGPAFVPTDLDPNNQTRSDARRTYFDPYVTRSNFHVITGQHVTRVLIEGTGGNGEVDNPTSGGNDNGNGPASGNNDGFGFGPGGSTPPLSGQMPPRFVRRQDPGNSNLRVSGVEFAPNASAPRQTVYATREVIVAAGALHSAQLLQLSGIGPELLLNQYNITVALSLPGVGNNLQDHPLVGTFYPYNNASYPSPTELTTNATYNLEAEQEYDTDKTGPWTAGSPNALAFNPLPLISNNSASILSNASSQNPTDYLVAGLDPTIIAGYTAQKQSLVTRLAQNTVAAYEIINNNAGSLTVSVMHPFSRGTCYIQSADPFQPPAIDPRWLTNPVDRQVLIEALLFNRQILATPPMVELQAAQFVPPVDADEDAINQVINNGIRTEFHPSGTLAMLPLEQGGVVDSHLRVWGTQNLRVVDAGIFPVIPAAHLQAVVYGVAEKAADIIKADNLSSSAVPAPSSMATALSTALATSSEVAVPTSAVPTSSPTIATLSTMADSTILATSSVPVIPSTTSTVQSVAISIPDSSTTSSSIPTMHSTASSTMNTSATYLANSAVFSVATSTALLSASASPNSTLQPVLSSTTTLPARLSASSPASIPQSSAELSSHSSQSIFSFPSTSILSASFSAFSSSTVLHSPAELSSLNSQPSSSQTSSVVALTAEISSIHITTSSSAASEPSFSSLAMTSATQVSSSTTSSGTSMSLSLSSPAQLSTSSTLPSSHESVQEFTTTLVSSLPNSISLPSITRTATSPSTTDHSTPAFSPTTLPGPEELTSSIIGVLTSAGVPSSVASSLAPIIVGSPPETTGIPSASSTATETEQQQEKAALVAFIQWFLSFFHLD